MKDLYTLLEIRNYRDTSFSKSGYPCTLIRWVSPSGRLKEHTLYGTGEWAEQHVRAWLDVKYIRRWNNLWGILW